MASTAIRAADRRNTTLRRGRFRHQASDRPGEHDPGHQPAHDVADDTATARFGCQVRGIRHEHLDRDRAHPDQERSGQELPWTSGQARAEQGQDGNAQERNHQAPVLDQVAQRHDQQQAQAIAGLRGRDNEVGRRGRHAERRTERPGQRLGVVDVGAISPQAAASRAVNQGAGPAGSADSGDLALGGAATVTFMEAFVS